MASPVLKTTSFIIWSSSNPYQIPDCCDELPVLNEKSGISKDVEILKIALGTSTPTPNALIWEFVLTLLGVP